MRAETGNKLAEKHGGAAAREAITNNAPFTGLAIIKQDEVAAELDAQGIDAVVERRVIRLQTASDLYYDALIKAAQAADIQKFSEYISKFGWLQSKALLGWAQVKRDRSSNKGKLASVLDAYENDAKNATEQPQDGQGGTE